MAECQVSSTAVRPHDEGPLVLLKIRRSWGSRFIEQAHGQLSYQDASEIVSDRYWPTPAAGLV